MVSVVDVTRESNHSVEIQPQTPSGITDVSQVIRNLRDREEARAAYLVSRMEEMAGISVS
jgi:hypothetical protein